MKDRGFQLSDCCATRTSGSFGYSLPGADYEFKHLLKRVQLSRKKPPEFVVITGGSETDSEYTYLNYQRFFGRDIKKDENFLRDGFSNAATKIATQ